MSQMTNLQRAGSIIHRAEAATYSSRALVEDAVSLIKDLSDETAKKDKLVRQLIALVAKGESAPQDLIAEIEAGLSISPTVETAIHPHREDSKNPKGVPEGYKRIAIDEDLFHVDFCLHAGDILAWADPEQHKRQKPNILRLINLDQSREGVKKYVLKAEKYKGKFVRIAAQRLSVAESVVTNIINDQELTEFLTAHDEIEDFVALIKERLNSKIQSN